MQTQLAKRKTLSVDSHSKAKLLLLTGLEPSNATVLQWAAAAAASVVNVQQAAAVNSVHVVSGAAAVEIAAIVAIAENLAAATEAAVSTTVNAIPAGGNSRRSFFINYSHRQS